MFIDVGLTTLEPLILQFFEPEAVAFQVIDRPHGDSARGEWAGRMGGVVRPLLKWDTQFSEDGLKHVEIIQA
jgi:lipopolysaccharide transport system ATP-binding protein